MPSFQVNGVGDTGDSYEVLWMISRGSQDLLGADPLQTAAGTLATHTPQLKEDSSLQEIDRQWRMLFIDDVVKNGGLRKKP
eukprot:gene1768-16251_t